jgi:hypothetical protein
MRTSKLARARLSIVTLLTVTGVSLAGCAGDATAPIAGTSPLAPGGVSKALAGAGDGIYTFTVDPSKNQSLQIGASHLAIAGHAICRLSDSGYGAAFWDRKCHPEAALLTITAVVSNASSDHPRIDFQPALRFSPDKTVNLYMHVDAAATSTGWNVLYCSTTGLDGCVDESLGDGSLAVQVKGQLVTRRIKHFSGYVVTNFASELY